MKALALHLASLNLTSKDFSDEARIDTEQILEDLLDRHFISLVDIFLDDTTCPQFTESYVSLGFNTTLDTENLVEQAELFWVLTAAADLGLLLCDDEETELTVNDVYQMYINSELQTR